jgi:nicotinamidase-related amidase
VVEEAYVRHSRERALELVFAADSTIYQQGGFQRRNGVDTVILTAVTIAGCVRHTAEDAIAEGFRQIVVRKAVGDRVSGVVQWDLFDIDAKLAEVDPLDAVLEYLRGLPAR